MDDAWDRLRASKPDPRIFWEFIHDERYQVVHLYEVRAYVRTTLRPGASRECFTMLDADDDGFGSRPTTHEFIMRDGPFAGRDPLDLCREGIAFWRDYLHGIDQIRPNLGASGETD
jgi:hypothetical protein